MFDDLGIFNDPDVILAQTAVGRIPPNQLLQVAGGAVTNIQGASGQAVVFTSGGGSGFSLSAVGAGNAVTFSISVSNAATARTALGLGTLAVRNAGVAVANAATVASAAYVQAEAQAVIDKLNELLNSLRGAVIISP